MMPTTEKEAENKSKWFIPSRGKVVFVHDLIMAALSIPISLFLRLGEDLFLQLDREYLIFISLGFALVAAVVFCLMRMYRGVWRYASLNDLVTITKAVTMLELVFIAALFLINRMDSYPRSAPIIGWFVLISLLGAPRFLYRLLKDKRYEMRFEQERGKKVPVLLYGAGNEADIFLRGIIRMENANYRAVGIIAEEKTEDEKRLGMSLHGVRIYGKISELGAIIAKLRRSADAPQRLILTRETNDGEKIRKIFNLASEQGLTLARLPKPDALRSGMAESIEVRPVAIEDLLKRPQRVLDRESMKRLIAGRKVLVTGAGGSIGSELTRQIASFNPSRLVMVENSEFNLYTIDMEMAEKHGQLSRRPVVADVRDKGRINRLLEEEKPELVFHAAALKHVPMTEENPIEGVLTNSLGTKTLADACCAHGVRVMVMISTDKAVNPTNVMGATKRLAESYCQALDLAQFKELGEDKATRFVTVRFGNVLGSTGSVVPLFQRQLAAGGPLTVTHPEVKRYFMTIREAVELVLQASALGSRLRENKGRDEPDYHGKIFVLEMGEPVYIADLARQIIRLAGLQPDIDVKVEFTGMRPGEKMFEEIFHGAEPLIKTGADGILLAEPRAVDAKELASELEKLKNECLEGNLENTLNALKRLVPEFDHNEGK